MIYYVSVHGSDTADGSFSSPFQTINHAAKVAVAGDAIKVFGGIYREWVDPQNGGTSDSNRIVYEAVEGERPVIKGSEIITDWQRVEGSVWKKELQNAMFGDWNPFALEVEGDWLEAPANYRVHLGDVYMNGVSLFEAKSMEDLYDGTPRITCCQNSWRVEDELILHPEQTVYKWYAVVTENTTTVFCNFQDYDPNAQLIEINVRPCCFYPKATGVNYITLRGFEIAQAACPWTPPTSHQIGMVGPHWSKGWIIENNDLHDAKCSALSLGKEESTGHNLHSRFHRKSGHRYQLEAVFSAAQKGWSRDSVGSHIVRNNEIHDCGQNGIVGHLGCIFSRIEHNHIYNIGVKHEFWGHEMAGIKFHGAIDTLVAENNIHNCTLGSWFDWQTQGCRITANLYYANDRDIMVEVSHGPYLIDHNVFMSQYAFDNWSQGGALVHNLFCGKIRNRTILERATPYHFPHSTAVAGYCEIYGGDDRYYNNIFAGLWEDGGENLEQFTKHCDRFTEPDDYAARIAAIHGSGPNAYAQIPQPVWIEDNAYAGFATPSVYEKSAIMAGSISAAVTESDGVWTLTLDIPETLNTATCKAVTTKRLGEPRIAAQAFEAPDGSDLDFSKDFLGDQHTDRLIPGPFASLKAGKQTIPVWKG
ncbi:MAG: right-handed parallel beta-helix repeat-containing protein [Clostridia bacterium]|nr:right-handed parallel beta-helix repeat-containing protein [Clostridia bacterium]